MVSYFLKLPMNICGIALAKNSSYNDCAKTHGREQLKKTVKSLQNTLLFGITYRTNKVKFLFQFR